MDTTPLLLPLLVHEVVSDEYQAPPDSEEAFFTLAKGQEVRVAQKVYLRTIGRRTPVQLPTHRPCYPLYDAAIEGPVVGARKRTVGVEYVVRNDNLRSPVRFAYIWDNSAGDVAASPEFVKEVMEGLENAARNGCEVWCMGRRTPTFLKLARPESRTARRVRLPKTARAPVIGLGPVSANLRMARRMHAPLKPSPLAQDASKETEE